MDVNWAREVRDQCALQGVEFFFKQWGGRTSKAGGRILDGELHDGFPYGFEKGQEDGDREQPIYLVARR